jgi:hypothetical protein
MLELLFETLHKVLEKITYLIRKMLESTLGKLYTKVNLLNHLKYKLD